jgi:hypothetical protein
MGSRTCWTPVDQTIRGECSSRGMLPPVRERIDATVWSTPVKKGRPRWFRARRSRSGASTCSGGACTTHSTTRHVGVASTVLRRAFTLSGIV